MAAAVVSMELNDIPGNEVKAGKILRCPQEGCGKEFRSSPGYRYHLKSHALDPRPHVCQCCHKKFKSANGLKYHLRKAHNIEPVLSKQNLGATSPKSRDSISSEEDHYISLGDSYPRNFLNNNNFTDRNANIGSPLNKSPLGGLGSPLLKNLPGIPSPLLKSQIDMPSYLSNSSNSSSLQSPYGKIDRYSRYFDKPGENLLRLNNNNNNNNNTNNNFNRKANSDYALATSRSSLSEYTQLCQQANNQFREQCQRLSCGELPSGRLPSNELFSMPQRSVGEMYRKDMGHGGSGSFSSDYHRHSIDSNESLSARYYDERSQEYNSQFNKNYFRDFPVPNEGKEYPNNLANHSSQCLASQDEPNSCSPLQQRHRYENNSYSNETTSEHSPSFRVPCSLQNTEQIVPDISVPNTSPNMPNSCDKTNNNNNSSNPIVNIRGTSESSNETELSDCVFRNENSNPSHSPPINVNKNTNPQSVILETKKISILENPPSCQQSAASSKPLLSRRISRSKSIPPPLTINACGASDLKSKDSAKNSSGNKLLHLAEIATSPRSPFHHSPLPLTLTPGILPESTPDWVLKSPFTKFAFPEKPFLSTPTIGRINAVSDQSNNESPITTSHSLTPSPSLENVQTPSFWPSQVWPTPVWLCFLKGCSVKFEQDDKEYRTSEEVAAFCTTPGGRRRDNMNFFTSGMKIVAIHEEKPSLTTARDMVSFTFEQIIPGPQRLVAKCAIDHPFYIKHKGWSASNPTEAMARYGQPFRKLTCGDIVIPAPQSKLNQSNPISPILTSSSGPQIFTFSPQDTSRFSQTRRLENNPTLHDKILTSRSSSCAYQSFSKAADTITLTYSNKSPTDTKSKLQPYLSRQSSLNQQKLANELRTISEAMKKSSSTNSGAKYGSSSEMQSLASQVSTAICLDRRSVTVHDIKQEPLSDTAQDTVTEERKCEIPIDELSNDVQVDATSEPIETQQAENEKVVKKQRKKRRKQLSGDEDKRRPMNGFMLFAKKMRIKLTQVHPGKDNRAISKLLGEKWRELSEEDREEYSRNAKEMADERMKVNPDCWKRKHRKEKDPILLISNQNKCNDNTESEQKKPRLDSGTDVVVPAAFIESHNIKTDQDSSIDVT